MNQTENVAFSPLDMEEMSERGAACGHGALAASLGITVEEAMRHLPPGWVNVPMMKDAISKSGRRWKRVDLPYPGDTAVILIQFQGPWTEPGRPPQAACRYRHWIAAKAGSFWDSNWPEWQTQEVWKQRAPELLPERSTGWNVWGSLVISPQFGLERRE